jgi:hypothetical protein
VRQIAPSWKINVLQSARERKVVLKIVSRRLFYAKRPVLSTELLVLEIVAAKMIVPITLWDRSFVKIHLINALLLVDHRMKILSQIAFLNVLKYLFIALQITVLCHATFLLALTPKLFAMILVLVISIVN